MNIAVWKVDCQNAAGSNLAKCECWMQDKTSIVIDFSVAAVGFGPINIESDQL